MLIELANQYLRGEIETIEEVVNKFNDYLAIKIMEELEKENNNA